MMKAGLPLMQAFEIVARGHVNPSMTQLLMAIRSDVEQGLRWGLHLQSIPSILINFIVT